MVPMRARRRDELAHDRHRKGAALRIAAQRARLVITDIGPANDIGRAADEPDIGRPRRGAGLAEQRQAQIVQAGRSAPRHHAFEHVDHLIGRARVEYLATLQGKARHRLAVPLRHVAAIAAPVVGAPDHLATAVLHIVDQALLVLHPHVGQRRIGIDHLGHRAFPGAQRIGEVGLILADPDPVERLGYLVHAGVVGDVDGHQVARLLKAPAHGVFTRAALAAKVAEALLPQRRALIDAERLVGHHRARRHPGIERGGIDEGLDRRARLTLGLRGAVEIVDAGIEPASKSQHPAIVGAFHEHPARNARHRPRHPDIADRLRGDDIARPHGVGNARERPDRPVRKADLAA